MLARMRACSLSHCSECSACHSLKSCI
jgi:hypothetical protein